MEQADWQNLCSNDMEALNLVLDEFFEEVRKQHPELVEKTLFKTKMAVAVHFDKESAEYVVCKMENADGTKGEHWSFEDTSKVMLDKGYDFEAGDWYYVLNMMYSDYYCKDVDDEYYIKLACQFLADKDAPTGKAKRYYMAMHFC